MKKGILLALEEGLEVKLLELPDGEDPDSFVKQFGKIGKFKIFAKLKI